MSTELFDLENRPGLTLSRYRTRDINHKPETVTNNATATYTPIETRCEAIKMEGLYKPSVSGSHYLSFSSLGPSKLSINDKVIFNITKNCDDPMGFFLGGVAEEKKQYSFVKGQEYKILLESLAPVSGDADRGGLSLLKGLLGVHTGFMLQEIYEEDLLTSAVEAAKSAEVALVFVGNTTAWETEGTLLLPSYPNLSRLYCSPLTKSNRPRYDHHESPCQWVSRSSHLRRLRCQLQSRCHQLHRRCNRHAMALSCVCLHSGVVPWSRSRKCHCRRAVRGRQPWRQTPHDNPTVY